MGTNYGVRPQGNLPYKDCLIDDFNQKLVTPFVTKNKFIITVDTTILDGGTETYPTSDSNQYILPAFGNNYTIEWFKKDDFSLRGSLEGNDETTITFPEPGIYCVIIHGGTFNRIRFSDGNRNTSAINYKDHNKMLEVNQWGDTAWSSLLSMFRYNSNMKMPAKDIPNLSNTTQIAGAFRNCSVFGSENEPSAIGDWDVSTITYFGGSSGLGLFGNCVVFNQNINDWDVSNGTDMSDMFRGATSFNQPLNKWDVSNVRKFFRAFESTPFNQPINSWDICTTGSVDMFAMFRNSAFNQPLDKWDTSQVTLTGGGSTSNPAFNGMFQNSDFNQDISMWDVSNLRNAAAMFRSDVFNQDIGQWNTQSLTTIGRLGSAFDQSLENWDLSSFESMEQMFSFTSISTENLSRTLVGWANFVHANGGPYDIFLSADNKTINDTVYKPNDQFTNAVDAKNYLVETVANGGAGWTITGATIV